MKLYHIALLLSLIVIHSCLPSFVYHKDKKVTVELNGIEYRLMSPPNTIELAQNYFVDQTEISNYHWSEYMYWTKTVFGDKSEQYLSIIPDQYVWCTDTLQRYPNFDEYYSNYTVYGNFPAVGITFEQANKYSKWRSDRVYEMTLIKTKNLENNYELDSLNYFTIEKYVNGQYFNIQPNLNVLVPIYTLPSIEQWESYATNIEDNKKDISLNIRNKTQEFATYENWLKDSSIVEMVDLRKYFDPKTELIHTIGNVSEMTLTKGISKGGSWKNKLENCTITNEFIYTKPTNWIGFRNVCSYYPASNWVKKSVEFNR
ncbi:MAG: SUMF1/EgtB/PvdO family nonheme iron enzyme [Chitinophagales bacterium]